uniref:glycoside hydrolase family 88/105 protein n=1 Tax=uncultured Altererythrobacter sp. TaxID=500840 RepID=UPI002630FB0A|nr:glycoside hydrolase family 88 protein [uncultured Altererythrobacter sp.]
MMKSVLSGLAASCVVLAMGTAAVADDHTEVRGDRASPPSVGCDTVAPGWRVPTLNNPTEASAIEVGCAVAQWQLRANNDLRYIEFQYPQTSYSRGWVKAAFYIGLDHFAAEINDPALLSRLRQLSNDFGTELGDRPWHGDDQAIAAVYAAVALRDGTPELMNKSAEQFDYIIDQNYTMSLEFTVPLDVRAEGECQKRWCWADAIFMAPPSWALATRVTGDPKYADYAASETRAVIEYLQDPKTGLLFRDSRYFDAKTPNGKPVFWSRGNGWVFAGLARFIDALPEDHPELPLMRETFLTLANQLVSIQREDGYWPTSLMDPEYLTNPETSGTAFFGFGLAWGLNNGLLEGDRYENARDKAWDAIRAAVTEDGKVGWVQQIGKDPQATTRESSQLYAAGGALLFAAEMIDSK